jgi:hypothetical protein
MLLNRFRVSKSNLSINYLELSYKILTGILLRKPMFGEILLKNRKQGLSKIIFKKIYYLY